MKLLRNEYKNVLNALYENVIISRSDDLYENMSTHWKSKWLKYRRYGNEHSALKCRVWEWAFWRFCMIIVTYENEHSADLKIDRNVAYGSEHLTNHENRTKMKIEMSDRWKNDPKRYAACKKKKCKIERIEERWAVGSAYESVLKIR